MSRVSSIRSAAQATFSAPRQVPIRWRLAGGSALLTLVILLRLRGRGRRPDLASACTRTSTARSRSAAELLAASVTLQTRRVPTQPAELRPRRPAARPRRLRRRAAARSSASSPARASCSTARRSTKDFGPPREATVEQSTATASRRARSRAPRSSVVCCRSTSSTRARWRRSTRRSARLRLFLIIGVLSGAGLALLAGLMVARRAMAPIAELTATARKIERTRDPAERIPEVEADDEVAELARTLDEMLHALDASRAETEDALRAPARVRRRRLARAAHAADERAREPRAARREPRRRAAGGRRLRAALLAAHAPPRRRPAAARAPRRRAPGAAHADRRRPGARRGGGRARRHRRRPRARRSTPSRAVVDGARDELHRLTLNLMENAIRHTPPGTQVRAARRARRRRRPPDRRGRRPRHPAPSCEARVFERFVRGAGDRGGSSGLGLSIVHAVAQSHGGTRDDRVADDATAPAAPRGTRFAVTLPLSASAEPPWRRRDGPRAEPIGSTSDERRAVARSASTALKYLHGRGRCATATYRTMFASELAARARAARVSRCRSRRGVASSTALPRPPADAASPDGARRASRRHEPGRRRAAARAPRRARRRIVCEALRAPRRSYSSAPSTVHVRPRVLTGRLEPRRSTASPRSRVANRIAAARGASCAGCYKVRRARERRTQAAPAARRCSISRSGRLRRLLAARALG